MPTCRLLLSGLVVLALFLAPLAHLGDISAAEHGAHASVINDGKLNQDGHTDHSHQLILCDAVSCTPSNIAGSKLADLQIASFLSSGWAGDDPRLRSLYLDGDPPVPRNGFSKT